MARVVVCDDDALVRASITAVCEGAGLEVVAETDSGVDATEMVRRFGVDLLVLDLSLPDGSGERALEALQADAIDTEIVVFTAYASDPGRLLRMGAREVVEKPDFDLLGDVIASLGSSVDAIARSDDRRVASRPVTTTPKLWRSPSGLFPHHELPHSVLELEVGDAVLAVTVVGLDQLEADVGPLLGADCRLAAAALLRDVLRIQDLLHEAPEIVGFLALLRGGDARAAGAVWSRLTAALRGSSLPGEVKGAASRVDALGADDAIARAVGALRSATVGSPAFLSV